MNTKLYFVFNDSAEHPAYHELQEQIQLLRNDWERVQRLEITVNKVIPLLVVCVGDD